MGTRTWAAALLALAGLGMPAYGQTTLEWKFKQGDKYYVEEISTVKQIISVLGKDINQSTKSTNLTSYTVKNVDADGATLEMKFESIKAKTEGDQPGGDFMEKIQEKMKGATF